jgi:two-component system chemotaxis response regulator CheY
MPNRSLPVLVVDDFATMCRIMKSIVQQLGYADVDTCQSGEAALKQLKSRNYGFILCDQDMDPMTGAEFARRARIGPYAVRCPIILTTSSRETTAQWVRDDINEVIDGLLIKPFKAADLRARLSFVEERERQRRAFSDKAPDEPEEEGQSVVAALQ